MSQVVWTQNYMFKPNATASITCLNHMRLEMSILAQKNSLSSNSFFNWLRTPPRPWLLESALSKNSPLSLDPWTGRSSFFERRMALRYSHKVNVSFCQFVKRSTYLNITVSVLMPLSDTLRPGTIRGRLNALNHLFVTYRFFHKGSPVHSYIIQVYQTVFESEPS